MSEQIEQVGKYSCSQLFGYRSKSQKLLEEDNITTVKFDPSGRFLALGDKAGRLILFQTPQQLQQAQEYDYFYEFEAHTPEFDTLKKVHTSQEVTHIDWMRPQGKYLRMMTASSHTVKLWKLYEKTGKRVVTTADQSLTLPQFEELEPSVCVNLKKSLPNPYFNPINSVGLSHNEEYIFTANQNAFFLWSVENSLRPFQLRQLKPKSNKKLQPSEKITCAQLHPQSQNIFALGTSRGDLSLIDARLSIAHPTVLDLKCPPSSSNFISQLIKQHTSVRFLSDSRKVVTRDLISVKVWDMCYNRQPLLNIPLDQSIKSHLCELFEAEVLEDKFLLTEANKNIVTGNYSNAFQIIDPNSGDNVQYQLDFGQQTKIRKVGEGKPSHPFNCHSRVLGHDFNASTGQLAVSTSSCFFIFSQENHQEQSSAA